MPNLLQKIRNVGGDVRCFHDECIWLDIGRPDDFALAQQMFREDRELFLSGDPKKVQAAKSKEPARS
jgi:NDP-sugar pyrophosphorylase family protein